MPAVSWDTSRAASMPVQWLSYRLYCAEGDKYDLSRGEGKKGGYHLILAQICSSRQNTCLISSVSACSAIICAVASRLRFLRSSFVSSSAFFLARKPISSRSVVVGSCSLPTTLLLRLSLGVSLTTSRFGDQGGLAVP